MITYILECVTIQLVFLLVYDLFLKKETFFQWNRIYLLGTFVLSMFLPWIKLEAFKTAIPENLVQYQQFFWQLDEVVLSTNKSQNGFWEDINWGYIFLGAGAMIMTIWLAAKLNHIYKLKEKGVVSWEKDFTKVIVPKSKQAFSFFRNVFMGADIPLAKQESILEHEMVHVKQRHSLDLMFFELMRIVFWFNPMVYLYQLRISELHEFIADAQASKAGKKSQYELLLSEVFQNQNFSLVNQFYKKSLIKKRIVMLTKEKSKAIYQFKYALLLPMVVGMLFYTSCGTTKNVAKNNTSLVKKPSDINKEIAVPFAVIEEVPIFPGCEDAIDKKRCFQEKMQEHIRKNFRYPKEAHEQGIQGRVNVIFVISKDGSITNFRKRGPHKLLEDEAKRIIDKLPKMQPGKQKGQAVEVPFSIPITFKLQGDSGQAVAKIGNPNSLIVTGKVDENGILNGKVMGGSRALPGVNITIEGTNSSAVTNFDGEYGMKVDIGDVVTFQFKGMSKVSFTISDKGNLVKR
ncbi:TonB family protein [Flagellimonas sp.]|uniref:TonB family protein n=1 Tax=Flagellimonas sp. TaxID=2058762 RepID=UPI003B599B0C